MAKIRLALKGDDLGTNHTTNVAFHDSYHKGLLRTAAVLANVPAIEEGAEMLAGEKGLCCVLHSCMNAEWDNVRWGPVLPPDKVPSLVKDDGTFFQDGLSLEKHGPKADEILAELQAQLDRLRALGFTITAMDAHMGWDWIIDKLGARERYLRWQEKEGIRFAWPFQRFPKVDVAGDPVEQTLGRLAAAPAGQYLIVGHPGYDTPEMRLLGHKGYDGEKVAVGRDWERRNFMDPRILNYVKTHDVEIIRVDEAK